MADKSDKIKKNYEDALKSASNLVTRTKESSEAMESLGKYVDDLTTALFKVSRSDFFKEIEKTPADIAKSVEKIREIKDELNRTNSILANDFKQNFKDLFKQFENVKKSGILDYNMSINTEQVLKSVGLTEDKVGLLGKRIEELQAIDPIKFSSAQKVLEEMKKNTALLGKELGTLNKDQIQKMVDKFKEVGAQSESLADIFGEKYEELFKDLSAGFESTVIRDFIQYGQDVEGFIKKHGKEAKNFLSVLAKNNPELLKSLSINKDITKELENQLEIEKKQTKQVMQFHGALKKSAHEIMSSGISFITQYDSAISKAQTETGILFKENNADMVMLTSQAAAFGQNIQETTQMMGQLGDELRTTDFATLSKAAGDFAAISGALGTSSQQITSISGEMMRLGSSAKQVKEAFEQTNVLSKKFGVNTKNVVTQIERNLKKMKEFGFTGGVKSLQKMAVEAERLRIQVDDIFNVAQKARSIEGAMEMAAELQLAAGSFSNINPMDLLSAARKGPEELGKILTSMGQDIGHFDKTTGEFKFDPIDVDRLDIVAKATGLTMESLQNTITKNAEDNKKLQLFPKSMFDFNQMSGDQKKMLTSLTEIGKDGAITFKQDSKTLKMLEKAGINTKDLSKLTAKQLNEYEKIVEQENSSLEQQNMRNASLMEAWDRLKNSLIAVFAIFEPAISWLAKILGEFAKWVGESGPMTKALTSFVLLAPLFAFTFMGAVTKMGGIISGFGGMISNMGGMVGKLGGTLSKVGGAGGGMAAGLGKKVSDVAGASSKLPGAGGGFLASLSAGIQSFQGVSPAALAKFALALGIIGTALVGFGFAMAEFGGEASMSQLATAGASLVLLGGSIFLLSKLSSSIDTKGVLQLSIAMGIIGLAMIPFAYSAKMMQEIEWETLGKIAVSIVGFMALMAGIGALLGGGGWLLLLSGVAGLVTVGIGLAAFGGSMLIASAGFEALSIIDWNGFSSMGDALLNVVPGLLAFSLASMAFLNPASLLGLVVMTTSIMGLTAAIQPLSSTLNDSSNGFSSFAESIGILSEAVARFDIDKFERISDASQNMMSNSVGSTITGLLSNITGGNKQKEETVTKVVHEIILKTQDGRELQRLILKDNELLS